MGYDMNNHTQLLIGKNIIRTGGAAGLAGTIATPSSIADGEIVITDVDGTILSSSTVTSKDRVVVVQGQGSTKPLIKSANILKSGVLSYNARAYTAGVEQIEYIGYNGTSGSIDVTNSNPYIVRSALYSNYVQFSDKQMFVNGDYVSDASATQSEVAAGLCKNLIYNTEKWPNIPYKVERVSNGSVADFTGTAVMVKLTKGSKTVEFMTAAAVASTGTTAVGDVWNIPTSNGKSFTFTASALGAGAGNHVIYLGTTVYTVADAGTAAQNATAIAAAINAGTQAYASVATADVTITYRTGVLLPVPVVYDDNATAFITVTIASGDSVPTKYIAATAATAGASFTLDIPYQGETGYFVGGTTAASMAGITTSITLWGLKLTGLPVRFKEGEFRYEKSKWTTTIQNFGATTVTLGTAPVEGSGLYEQVANDEWFYQLGEGFADNMTIQTPPVTWRKNVELTGLYSLVNLRWKDGEGTSIISNPTAFKQLSLACNKGPTNAFVSNSQFNTSGSPNTSVVRVLDAWLSTFTAQVSSL